MLNNEMQGGRGSKMRFQAKNCKNSGPNWSFKQMSSGNGRNRGHPYAQMQGMLCLEDGTN